MKANQSTQAVITVLIYGIFWWATITTFQAYLGGDRFVGWQLLLYLCPICWVMAHIMAIIIFFIIGALKIKKLIRRRS